jgi:hypothetical protein
LSCVVGQRASLGFLKFGKMLDDGRVPLRLVLFHRQHVVGIAVAVFQQSAEAMFTLDVG